MLGVIKTAWHSMYSTNNRMVNSRAERGKQEQRMFIIASLPPPKKKTFLSTIHCIYLHLLMAPSSLSAEDKRQESISKNTPPVKDAGLLRCCMQLGI